MQTTVNERIKQIVDYIGKSITSISKEIGIAQPTFRAYVEEQSKPSFDTIQKLVEVYGINAEWLITGRGEMLHKGNMQHNTNSPNSPQLNGNGSKKINYDISGNTISEISKSYQEIIQIMQKQIDSRDEQIKNLTDKLIDIYTEYGKKIKP